MGNIDRTQAYDTFLKLHLPLVSGVQCLFSEGALGQNEQTAHPPSPSYVIPLNHCVKRGMYRLLVCVCERARNDN